jgi:hypothetical protein
LPFHDARYRRGAAFYLLFSDGVCVHCGEKTLNSLYSIKIKYFNRPRGNTLREPEISLADSPFVLESFEISNSTFDDIGSEHDMAVPFCRTIPDRSLTD